MFHVEQFFGLATEVNQQNGNISGGDPGDSGSLSNCLGLISFQLLAAFYGQSLKGIKVKI